MKACVITGIVGLMLMNSNQDNILNMVAAMITTCYRGRQIIVTEGGYERYVELPVM
jgi:hypothetical protein